MPSVPESAIEASRGAGRDTTTATRLTVRVVIVTHDRPELLERTLLHLTDCDLPPEFRGTIIIENGPGRRSFPIVTRSARRLSVVYRRLESPRKCDALNTALNLVGQDLLVFLDDDVRPAPAVLRAYVEAARVPGYFGGPIMPDYDALPPDWLVPFLPPSAVGWPASELSGTRVRYPTCFLGFNWAAFAHDLRRCGGFSSRFGPGTHTGGGDESFMQLQLNRVGIEGVYVPDAVVWHYVPRERCSPDWTLRRAYGAGFNAGIFAADYARSRRQSFGLVRSFVRNLRRHTRLVSLTDLLCLPPSGRFWIRHTSRWLAAFALGYRYGCKHRPLEFPNWTDTGIAHNPHHEELGYEAVANGQLDLPRA